MPEVRRTDSQRAALTQRAFAAERALRARAASRVGSATSSSISGRTRHGLASAGIRSSGSSRHGGDGQGRHAGHGNAGHRHAAHDSHLNKYLHKLSHYVHGGKRGHGHGKYGHGKHGHHGRHGHGKHDYVKRYYPRYYPRHYVGYKSFGLCFPYYGYSWLFHRYCVWPTTYSYSDSDCFYDYGYPDDAYYYQNAYQQPAAAGVVNIVEQQPAAAAPQADVAFEPRQSNFESRMRAGTFIGYGDALFTQQQYLSAAERYKTAISYAPDLAIGYFRRGFAYVALGHYDLAAQSFKQGLWLDPNWHRSDFKLDSLFGRAIAAKENTLDNLAQTALAQADNADVMFLLGVMLYFDGQENRSMKFFARAVELSQGQNADHLQGFAAGINQDAAQVAGRNF